MMADALGQPPNDRHGLSAFSRHCGNGRPPHNSTSAVFTDRLQQISIPANQFGCPRSPSEGWGVRDTSLMLDLTAIRKSNTIFQAYTA